MSYMDTGDDELDYGEEELGERDAGPASFQTEGAIFALADDEMVQEEDYDDLYDDVNIGYFQAPSEPFRQRGPVEGKEFGADYEEEEAFGSVAGRSPGGVHGGEEGNKQERTVFEQSGAAKVEEGHTFQIPGQSGKEEVRSLPVPQLKEEQRGDIGKEQIASLRSADPLSARPREGLPPGHERQNKDEPSSVASFAQTKPQEDIILGEAGLQVGWTSERASAPSQPKEQGDYVSNGPEQRASAQSSYRSLPSKERGGRGNGTILSGKGEAIANAGHIGNGTDYDGIGMAGRDSPSGQAKTAGSGHATGGAGMLHEGVKATTAGLARSSHGGPQRSSTTNVANDYVPRHGGQTHSGEGRGATMLFVGELNWWTTDAELEAALSEFGRVRDLKFSEERASGKSRGYCQVEFYDHAAAAACKEGMNGRKFNDRPCVVAFANTRTIQHMGNAQVSKAQAQLQAQQTQNQFRRGMNDGARGGPSYQGGDGGRSYQGGDGNRTYQGGDGGRSYQGGDGSRNYQGGDGNRNYGRMGNRVSHGQGMGAKGGPTGSGRGRGNLGGKNSGGGGGGGIGGVPFGQGLPGPMGGHPSGIMMPQAMMGQGYDPSYGPPMGRGGAAYGGYVVPGPHFPGMVPSFPNMGHGGLPGVAPHVNPAFFGRSASANGMGMMPGSGMDTSHPGMWGEATMSGWGGEDHERRAREASYGEDVGGSEYAYGHEKGRTSGTRDKDRGADGDWAERRHRDDRDGDWERERHRERERDGYREPRERERERDKDDDWERDRAARIRSKARIVEEEEEDKDQRPRLREEEFGKRRRVAAER